MSRDLATAVLALFVVAVVALVGWRTTASDIGHGAVAYSDSVSRSSLADDARSLARAIEDISKIMSSVRALAPVPTDPAAIAAYEKRKARAIRQQVVAVHGRVRQRPLAYDPQETIFVSICSFRDLQCAPTIYDMYDKAKYPRNIHVGAVMQHEPGDKSCVPPEYATECRSDEWCPSDNIKTRLIDPKVAKGPTFGRYYAMLMYRSERYFLLIDSHMRWVTHWDHILLAMYKGLPTKKGVLAHYPDAWINPEDAQNQTNAPLNNRPTTMYMCTAHWLPELGFVRMGGFVINRKAKFGKDMCRPQPYAGAGFMFSYGTMVEEVPFDPHLQFVFDGEEILYSIRMWTHGWDIVSPSENINYTITTAATRRSFGESFRRDTRCNVPLRYVASSG
jgi:hypothetical protein